MKNKFKYVHMYNEKRELEAALAYESVNFNFQEMVREVRLKYKEVYWINIDQETNEANNLILIKK